LRSEFLPSFSTAASEGLTVHSSGASVYQLEIRLQVVEIMRIKGIDSERAPDNVRAAFRKSVERFGRVITPNLAMAHRPEIFLASRRLNQAIAASSVVDGRLKTLAFVRTAQMIECPF
jgi:hypothetical protein